MPLPCYHAWLRGMHDRNGRLFDKSLCEVGAHYTHSPTPTSTITTTGLRTTTTTIIIPIRAQPPPTLQLPPLPPPPGLRLPSSYYC